MPRTVFSPRITLALVLGAACSAVSALGDEGHWNYYSGTMAVSSGATSTTRYNLGRVYNTSTTSPLTVYGNIVRGCQEDCEQIDARFAAIDKSDVGEVSCTLKALNGDGSGEVSPTEGTGVSHIASGEEFVSMDTVRAYNNTFAYLLCSIPARDSDGYSYLTQWASIDI